MSYRIASIPTRYAGVNFRSRLEARWAAFFDLNELEWSYEPVELTGWIPDFHLKLPCTHGECCWNGLGGDKSRFVDITFHELYVEVKPFTKPEEWNGHPSWKYWNAHYYEEPAVARFGLDWRYTSWEMAHGPGGGESSLESHGHYLKHGRYDTYKGRDGNWYDRPSRGSLGFEGAWREAGNMTQWKPKRKG